MTYCVGLRLNHGLVFMSDTRTNAGVDNFSTTRKQFCWEVEGERVITIMTAGNLATTQSLISLLEERSKLAEDRNPSILSEPTMFQVARLVGATLREVIAYSNDTGVDKFRASVIVGGQIRGGEPTIFMVYPEGNFIEVTEETPFFQIGETKYGKPILVRGYDPEMTFADTVKLLLVSFDSTVKSNLSVGLPFDILCYRRDTFSIEVRKRVELDDPVYRKIAEGWSKALRESFLSLPDYDL